MKTQIFFFSSDDDSGMSTQLFNTREALAEAIHKSIESHDEETATAMRALPFGSEDWSHLWCEHVETRERKSNFYHFGAQSIDVPSPAPTWHGSHIMQVPVISTSHIQASDGAQLALNREADILAPLADGSGHIVHFNPHTIQADFDSFTSDFHQLLRTLASDGYVYVRLDCDGAVVPGLPTFTW